MSLQRLPLFALKMRGIYAERRAAGTPRRVDPSVVKTGMHPARIAAQHSGQPNLPMRISLQKTSVISRTAAAPS